MPQASVTIPDVTVVIDSCRVKEMTFDGESQLPSLVMGFAPKDSLRQRAGRAGRTQMGRCFRLIHTRVFDSLPSHGVPEILRTPLDRLVLHVAGMMDYKKDLSLELEGLSVDAIVAETLSRCPDPPPEVIFVYLSSFNRLPYFITLLRTCVFNYLDSNSTICKAFADY